MELPDWFLLLNALIVVVLVWIWIQNRGLPPGPWGLPFIGYYPYVMSNNHVKLANLAKKYGEIFCFRSLGGRLYIVLHGMPILKDVFVNSGDEFIGRPLDTNFLNWADEQLSMTNMDTEVWKEQRRFFLSSVKNYGFGKLVHEKLMHEVIENLINEIKSYEGKPFDIHSEISNATYNIFSEIVCGKQFAKDDPKYLEFKECSGKMLSHFHDSLFFVGGIFYDLYIRFTSEGRMSRRCVKDLYDFADEMIDEHERTIDVNNPRDFIDSYLIHMKNLEKEGKLQESSFSRKRLTPLVFSNLIEGMATTGVSLYVLLVKLAEHEEVQKKMQQETDDVIGDERMPSFTDKPKMPYTEAVLLELFRTTWPFTISTYYSNHQEARIRGYRIPKRSNIIFNMWEISNNPETFPEPTKFDPNRFLGPNAVNWREKGPIPFGIGKRSCPGEAMAQVEVFIMVAAFMQNFTLYPAENGQVKAISRDKEI